MEIKFFSEQGVYLLESGLLDGTSGILVLQKGSESIFEPWQLACIDAGICYAHIGQIAEAILTTELCDIDRDTFEFHYRRLA